MILGEPDILILSCKMNMKFRTVIYAIALSLLLISCDKEKGDGNNEPAFVLVTKAVGEVTPNTTYRVIAYYGNSSSSQYRHYNSSGTYQLKAGDEVLSSCRLDADGQVIDETAESSLNGMSGNYFLVLTSPGRALNDDGSVAFTPEDLSDQLKINKPMLSTLGNYGTIEFTEALYDPRSRIQFKIYKDESESVEDITVTSAYLTSVNAPSEAVSIYPSTRQVRVTDPSALRSLELNVSGGEVDGTGHELFYTTDLITIASGYYSPKSVVAQVMGMSTMAQSYLVESNYIYFGCDLQQGARDKVQIRIPINANYPEMMPQMDYIYRVTIRSNYIVLELDIYDSTSNAWQEGGEFRQEVSTPSGSYTIGTWAFDSWGVTEDLSQEIG